MLLTFSFPGEPGVYWFRRGPFYDFLFNGDVFDLATGYRTSVFSNAFVLPEFDALDAAKIDDPKKLDVVKRTLDLRGRHLEGANFSDADLRKVDLSRAYLQGARFVDARLQGAVLRDAKLQGATLDGAQLQGARLDFASLQGASLDDAQLQGASLGGSELQGASLQGAKLQGASLQDAKLQGALLSGAQLQGASLEIAKLQGANFRKSYSYHTYRGYEELVTSTYTDMGYAAVLAGTYMGNAAVWRSNFEGASLTAVFTDGLTESAISKDEFATLKTIIMDEVPEGSQRDEALTRIETLNPDIFGPEPSQTQTLGNGRADKAAYQKALADQLKDLVCSSDQYASYIVRGLLTEPVWTFAGTSVSRVADTGRFAPALIESILAPACPVSAALTEQDKAELRKRAKETAASESKP